MEVQSDDSVLFKYSRPLECDNDQTFVIPIGTSFDIINAWNPDSYKMSYHESNKRSGTFTLFEDGTCLGGGGGDEGGDDHNGKFIAHGYIMWFSWCLISIMQIFTNRYLRHKWKWRQLLHSVLGFISLLLFGTGTLIAFQASGWIFSVSFHAIIGRVAVILGLFLVFAGIFTSYIKFKRPMEWNTNKKLCLSKCHGIFGYLVILLSQLVVAAGLNNYFAYLEEDQKGYILIGLSTAFFILAILVGEIIYQMNMRKDVPFIKSVNKISVMEFERRVEYGELLVILDELVLDVSKFVELHPGGQFVIKHNAGRDISKFFYGGYSLEGNIGAAKPAKGYVHSPYARMIINDLVIGTL